MSKKSQSIFILGVVLSVVATAGVAIAAVAPEGNLEVSLTLVDDEAAVDSDRDIRIRFTLTNLGSNDLSVLRWQTPLGGIEHPILMVERNGEPTPYIGKMVKRGAPIADDYITVEAGRSVSTVFDPTSAYQMSLTGSYSLVYQVALQAVASIEKNASSGMGVTLQSNLVDLWVEGDDVLVEPDFSMGYEKSLSYSNCTNSQRSAVATAFADATTIAGNALNDLNGNNACYYTKWFGTSTTSRYNTVTSHFSNIVNAFQTKAVVVDCGCSDSAFAYVYPNQPYKIWVCNAFWNAAAIGYDSKAGTLVHEMSHFNVVAGTDDHVYGQSGCQSLAQSNPTQAIDNADSHEYNVENTYLSPCAGGGGGGGGGGTTQLQNAVPETGLSAAKNQELDFTLQVPSGASGLVFQTIGSNGDADLYVKFGSQPTTSSYDCRGYNGGSNETCNIASASAGTYYVMVQAYKAFSGLSLEGSYSGGGGAPCTSCDHYSGSLSGDGDYDAHPDGTYYHSASGTHKGWLEGPSSADFDLFLYRWNGSWVQVDKSESGTSSESISYNGSSGYYYWKISSYNGSGSYDFWLDRP